MITVPYRYADGVAYRPNLFLIKENAEDHRSIGGVVVLKNKALAFKSNSPTHLVQDKIATIIRDADAIEWGNDAADALKKLEKHYRVMSN